MNAPQNKESTVKQAAEHILCRVLQEALFLRADEIRIAKSESGTTLTILKSKKAVKLTKASAARFGEIQNAVGQGVLDEYVFSAREENNEIVLDKPAREKYSAAGRAKITSMAVPVVLIVEDDPDQSKMLEMMLKDLKYEVHVAANGEEALQQAAEKAPDLIISDIMMPKMDGTEFVKKIKRNPAYQNIPILVLTVISDPEKEFTLLNLGVDDYCQKTMQRNILVKRIENLVNRHMHAP